MPNQLLTTDKITSRALAVLHETATVPPNVNRQYDDQFANSGGKVGERMRARKPARFIAAEGPVAPAQDIIDEYVELGIYKQFNVRVDLTSREMTLSLDDLESQVLRPAMAVLASKIDQYCFDVINANCGSAIIGTGTGQTITWKDIVKAGAYLDQFAVPRDSNRSVLINPITQVGVLDETKGLLNAPSDISEQYREGVIGRTGGFLFTSASRAPVLNIPSDVTGTVNGNYIEGSKLINLSGLAPNTLYQAGLVFTVANVFDVHPETKVSLGRLHQFVVVNDFTTDASGNINGVSIHPLYESGARKNITALPVNNAAVTFLGTPGASYRQSFAFHRDAFVFVSADLIKPDGAVIKRMDNISMRYAYDWIGNSDVHIKRFDVLCGLSSFYPEMAVKLLEPNT